MIEHAGPEGHRTGLDVAAELRSANPTAIILLVTMIDPQRLEPRCHELGVRLVEKGCPDLENEVVREIAEGLANKSGTPGQEGRRDEAQRR
jgi:hypothetical protein